MPAGEAIADVVMASPTVLICGSLPFAEKAKTDLKV